MHTSGCAQHPCAPALVRARGCAVRASALVSPWHPWRRERPSERAAKLVTHASAGEEEESPALRFFKGLQGGLPVIGLVSRLASPSGGFENKLSYPEYCRKAFEREGSRDFAVAIAELARNRKLNSRTLMFVCWMVSQGAGIVTDDVIKLAASRISGRNADLEFEVYRFEEVLDAAVKRRARLRPPPALPSRAESAALADTCLRTLLRLAPEDQLTGEDGGYMQVIAEGW